MGFSIRKMEILVINAMEYLTIPSGRETGTQDSPPTVFTTTWTTVNDNNFDESDNYRAYRTTHSWTYVPPQFAQARVHGERASCCSRRRRGPGRAATLRTSCV